MWKKCTKFEKFLITIGYIISLVCYFCAIIAFFEHSYLYMMGMLLGMLGGILLKVIVSDDSRRFNRLIDASRVRTLK